MKLPTDPQQRPRDSVRAFFFVSLLVLLVAASILLAWLHPETAGYLLLAYSGLLVAQRLLD